MSKYTWRKHDVEELHNSDDLQEISKLAHLAIIRLRDALWRRNGNSIKPGAIPTSILYERSEWESVQHEVIPFFDFDKIGIFCADILEQVGRAQDVREARSRAGKTSAQVRNEHMLNTRSTHVEHVLEQSPTYVQQDVQQRRGEEKRGEENRGEEKKEEKPSRKKEVVSFIPPTQEEVRLYMTERGWKDPEFWAEKWIDHYQPDYKISGGKKMTDWQRAVRTWEQPNRMKKTSVSETVGWDL